MQKGTPHKPESVERIRLYMEKKWAGVTKEDRSKIMSERRRKGMNGHA